MLSSKVLQATNPATPHHVSIRLLISARSPAVIPVDKEKRIELRPRLVRTTSSSLSGNETLDLAAAAAAASAAACFLLDDDTDCFDRGDETLDLRVRFGGIFGRSRVSR